MSFMATFQKVLGLHLRTLVLSKRGILTALPVVLFLLLLALGSLSEEGETEHLRSMTYFLFSGPLGFLLPFLSLLAALTVTSDDLDKGMAAYLFVRPLSRIAILTGRMVAAVALVLLYLLPAVLLAQIITGVYDWTGLVLPAFISLLIGAFAYITLFSFLAVFVKNPLAIGLIYVFVIDLVLSNIPFKANVITIRHHLLQIWLGLAPQNTDVAEDWTWLVQAEQADGPGLHAVGLVLFGVLLLVAAFRRYNRSEA